MRVLIADDNIIARETIKVRLKIWDYEVISVENGREAWDILKNEGAPRLAVLDWMMPEMSGLDVCRRVRQREGDYTYILLLTAKSGKKDIVEGLNAGADDYLIKPFVSEELQSRLIAAKRILDLHEELAKLNHNLELRVESRTEEIQRLLQQKEAFVNQLGHDLKTPLTPMVALLPKLIDETENPEHKEILQLIGQNVSYMQGLVENILTLATLNNECKDLIREKVNLAAEVKNVIQTFSHTLSERNLVAGNNVHKSISINAAPICIKELLHNLISNAVKYSSDNGTIKIDASVKDKIVTVKIQDAGIGMTRENAGRAFEEFFKADESRHDLNSSGLGLSICKRIIQAHGGEISIASAGLGKGTTAMFTLAQNC